MLGGTNTVEEDQDRDFVAHMRDCLRLRQESELLHVKKILGDRDILGKGLDHFWNDFRKVMGDLCERLSREFGLSLSCRWNGKELNVTTPNKRQRLNAEVGDGPPYEIVISGRDGLQYHAVVQIKLEDSQLDWLATTNESPVSARQTASTAVKALILA